MAEVNQGVRFRCEADLSIEQAPWKRHMQLAHERWTQASARDAADVDALSPGTFLRA